MQGTFKINVIEKEKRKAVNCRLSLTESITPFLILFLSYHIITIMNFPSFDPFTHTTVATKIKTAKKAKAYVINQFKSEQKSSTMSSLTEKKN